MAASRGVVNDAMRNGPISSAVHPPEGASLGDATGRAGSMYGLKPFYDPAVPISLPTCMYALAPFHLPSHAASGHAGGNVTDVNQETTSIYFS